MSSAQLVVVVGRVDREADDLDAAPVELGLDLRHVAELGRADRREVLRVREQHRPRVADPLVEPDRAFGGLRLEVRRGIPNREGQLSLLFSLVLTARTIAVSESRWAHPRVSSIRSPAFSAPVTRPPSAADRPRAACPQGRRIREAGRSARRRRAAGARTGAAPAPRASPRRSSSTIVVTRLSRTSWSTAPVLTSGGISSVAIRQMPVEPGVAPRRVRRDVAARVAEPEAASAPATSSSRRASRTGAAARSRRGRCSSCSRLVVKSSAPPASGPRRPTRGWGRARARRGREATTRSQRGASRRCGPERGHHRGREAREDHQPHGHQVPEERPLPSGPRQRGAARGRSPSAGAERARTASRKQATRKRPAGASPPLPREERDDQRAAERRGRCRARRRWRGSASRVARPPAAERAPSSGRRG